MKSQTAFEEEETKALLEEDYQDRSIDHYAIVAGLDTKETYSLGDLRHIHNTLGEDQKRDFMKAVLQPDQAAYADRAEVNSPLPPADELEEIGEETTSF